MILQVRLCCTKPGFTLARKPSVLPQRKMTLCTTHLPVHTKSVSRPRGCRRRNTKTRKPENGENGGNAKHENGKKRKRENGENAKTAKTRKRTKQENRVCRKQKNTTINYRSSNQRRTEMGKAQKEGNAKTRKRQKVFSFSSCPVLHRSGPFRSTLTRQVITALGICILKYVPKQSIP